MYSQIEKTIQVSFNIEGEPAVFSDMNRIEFTVGNNKVVPLQFLNGFVVPDFGDADVIDVCFIINGEKYCFRDLPVSKFETDWEFGVDRKPFNKEFKPADVGDKFIYFLKFFPKNGGDGTQVVVSGR